MNGVGENLQDQTNIALAATSDLNFTGTGPYVVYANSSDLGVSAPSDSSIASWVQTVAEANDGTVNASALTRLFQIQRELIFEDLVPDAEMIITGSGNTIVIAHWGLMPFSRGSVHIASASPLVPPSIDPKYFVAGIDMTVQIAITKLARSALYTQPLSEIVLEEILPGDSVPINGTDTEWANFLKNTGRRFVHFEASS